MKHRVRLHGKKPKEKNSRRQPKVVRKPLTLADMVKAVRHRAWPNVMQALADGVHPDVNLFGDPLVMAVAAIAPERVVAAVLKAGADPNATNRKGQTALFHATDPRVTALLCSKGADVRHRAKGGHTALHVLADAGQAEAIKAVLAAGADVDSLDDAARTPLVRAIAELRLATIEVLLAAQADANFRTKDGLTLLHNIVGQRSKSAVSVVEMLLRAGADPNACTANGATPLMLVATVDAAELLLSAGADANAATPQGVTPLLQAVQRQDIALVQLLLRAKANPTTARAVALKSPNSELRRLFTAR